MFAYVGGYTTQDRDGRGNGIHVYRVDASSGGWTHVQHVDGEENPSLFTLHPDNRVLYAVHGGRTHVSAFAIDRASGHLHLLNRQPCGGTNPVDAALDATNHCLVVANYGSGNVAVLPLAEDGAPGERTDLLDLVGSGPDRDRQAGPHAHMVRPDRGEWLVADLGSDRVWRCRRGKRIPTPLPWAGDRVCPPSSKANRNRPRPVAR